MKERTLLKIALTCTLLGIITLLLLSEIIDVNFYTINEIRTLDDTQVRTNGIIERITKNNNVTTMTISRLETIDITIFNDINATKGQEIEVIGKTNNYNNKQQIIADKISFKN